MKNETPTIEEVQEYFKNAAEGISLGGNSFKEFGNIEKRQNRYLSINKKGEIWVLWRDGKYAEITKTKADTMKTEKPTLEEVQEYFKDALEGISVNFEIPFKGFKNIYFEHGKYYCKIEYGNHRTIWDNGIYATITKTKETSKQKPLSKYHVDCNGQMIDVYDVLKAFNVTNPATQHAVKKLLKGGERGFKDVNKDYNEAIESIQRAIELNN
jgi:uncharacterized protein YdhG (YjbR/CyaY superfamily)